MTFSSARLLVTLLLVWTAATLPASAQMLPPASSPNGQIELLDLRGCSIGDAARMVTALTGTTVVSTESARVKTADALIENLDVEAALKVICRSSGLVYRYDEHSRLFTILGLEEYQRTAMEESKNVFETRIFKVGTANLNQIASSIVQLYGSRVIVTGGMPIEDFREAPGNNYATSSYSNRGARINGGNIGRTGASGNRSNNTSAPNFNNPYGIGYGSGMGYGNAYGVGYGGGFGYNNGFGNTGMGYGNAYGMGYGGGFGYNNGFGNAYGGGSPYGGGYGNASMYGGYMNNNGNGNAMNGGRVDSSTDGVPSTLLNSESILANESVRAGSRPLTKTEALEQSATKTGSPLIYISTSYEHSYLLVRTADRDALQEISKLITQLDEVVPQVVLEMKILQLDVGEGFTGSASFSVNNRNPQFAPSTRDPATGAVTAQEFAGYENALNIGNFASNAAANFAYQYLSDQISARVELLASDNRVEVLATPLLIATNNRSAQIEVGEERVMTIGASSQVVDVPTGLGTSVQREYIQTNTERRTIGVVLDILPRINEDGTVTLSVVQESTTLKPKNNTIQVGTSTVQIDSVDTANVDATVVAKDNCTIAIGGLIRTENSVARAKVPVLGDIPGLGLLFKRKERAARKTELVLLITPHILHGKGKGQDTEITRQIMTRLSDHRYNVGGEEIIDRDIPELQTYRSDTTQSYRNMTNNQEVVPEKTQYWENLTTAEKRSQPAAPIPAEPATLLPPPGVKHTPMTIRPPATTVQPDNQYQYHYQYPNQAQNSAPNQYQYKYQPTAPQAQPLPPAPPQAAPAKKKGLFNSLFRRSSTPTP